MTDIRNTSPAVLTGVSALSGDTPKNVGDAKIPLSLAAHQSAPAAVMQEITQLSGTLDLLMTLGKSGGTQNIANKAPTNLPAFSAPPLLPEIVTQLSPEDMALVLTGLQLKTSEAQIGNAKEGLNFSKKKMEDLNAKAMDKIKTMIESAEKASKMNKSNGIMGWVSKIGAFLGAVVGVLIAAVVTVATLGVAAPLLALAAVGLVGPGMSLIGHISVSAGGPPLDFASLATQLVTKILVAVGDVIAKTAGLAGDALAAFKEKAKSLVEGASQMTGGIVACATLGIGIEPGFFGNIFGGFAKMVGTDEAKVAIITASFTAAASLAIAVAGIALAVITAGAATGAAMTGIMQVVSTGGKLASGAMQITAGALSVAQGAVGIAKAYEVNKGDIAMVDKKIISALLIKLQAEMEEGKDEIKKTIDQIMDGFALVSQMINSGGLNREQINSNMGGKRQTI